MTNKVRINCRIQKDIYEKIEREAQKSCGGKISPRLRQILQKHYQLFPKEEENNE